MMGQNVMTDSDAVAANRAGELTADQRGQLISQSGSFGILGLLLFGLLTFATVKFAGTWLAAHEIVGAITLLAIIIVSAIASSRIYSIPMRHRLTNARVEQVPGEVAWNGYQYTPKVDGKRMMFVATGASLPPGHYTFYRLQGTSWVLSAEMAGGQALAQATPYPMPAGIPSIFDPPPVQFDPGELTRALAASNWFTEDDLQSNRAGQMSGHQVRKLLTDIRGNLWGMFLAAGFAIFLIYVAAHNGKNMPIQNLLVVLLFPAGIIVAVAINCFRDLLDVVARRVYSLDDYVRRYSHSSGRSPTTLYYQVGPTRFEVSVKAYNALIEGVRYRVYFAPNTHKLMSIEPLL
jgi:hypothetical protein